MKKIHILLFFLINSVFSFANLTDNLNLLKEDKIVEERMKQLAEEKNLTVL